jgi:hypothetical protein
MVGTAAWRWRLCGPYPGRRCWTAPCRCVSHLTDGLHVPRTRKLVNRQQRTVCHSLTSTKPHLYAQTTTESTSSTSQQLLTPAELLRKAPQACCIRWAHRAASRGAARFSGAPTSRTQSSWVSKANKAFLSASGAYAC